MLALACDSAEDPPSAGVAQSSESEGLPSQSFSVPPAGPSGCVSGDPEILAPCRDPSSQGPHPSP